MVRNPILSRPAPRDRLLRATAARVARRCREALGSGPRGVQLHGRRAGRSARARRCCSSIPGWRSTWPRWWVVPVHGADAGVRERAAPRRLSLGPARMPSHEAEREECDGGPGDGVEQVVVARRDDRHGHQHGMRGGGGLQPAAAGDAEERQADEQAPADVHGRHGRVGVELDAAERAGVVAAGEPHRVGDAELRDEARRRGGEDDEDHARDEDGEQQGARQLGVRVAAA